jgi:hypothetical protein
MTGVAAEVRIAAAPTETTDMPATLPVLDPPDYCEYEAGPCDQDFTRIRRARALFLYPSRPDTIASTIEAGVGVLRKRFATDTWTTWKEFKVTGQLVFCEICKRMRGADVIVADVTTLNFNLLFEIGVALGLGIPVIPIRDTSIVTNTDDFVALGLLDTIGFADFRNSDDIATRVGAALDTPGVTVPSLEINREVPLYVVRGHVKTEGDLRIFSTLKGSALRFRMWDPEETPRISLYDVQKNVASSMAVLVHLMSSNRAGANVHNARCALVAGLAMASGKQVLMLQEEHTAQPIDYRDLVFSYTNVGKVPKLLEDFIRGLITSLQDSTIGQTKTPPRFLERINLGDIAAENEIVPLRSYFVRTAQFSEARRGTARIVVGRKGAGKTALFYGLRDSIPRGHGHIVLDLKPEGHQFTKLREVVLSRLTLGLQEHTLTAFWNYILLCELAERVREADYSWAERDERRHQRYTAAMAEYSRQVPADVGDFSERLARQVDRLEQRFSPHVGAEQLTGGALTEMLFSGEIRALDDALAPYLQEKDAVWILVDNLDKGWPTRGARSEDILILRTLLEATRKLQRQFDQREVEFHSLVFLRNDIYDHLLVQTPDKGKETSIALYWDDEDTFREIVRQRMASSTGLDDDFPRLWGRAFTAAVGAKESFHYMTERTLMRPRDLLTFVNRAVGVAINRGHEQVTEDDILKAEESYSEDMLINTVFELKDVYPESMDALYKLAGAPTVLDHNDITNRLNVALQGKLPTEEFIEILLWFGFLGVAVEGHQPMYSYQVRYNIDKLLAAVDGRAGRYVIHPAFHHALEIAKE